MLTFMETWLCDNIPDAAIQLEGMTLFRVHREAATSVKIRGGGLKTVELMPRYLLNTALSWWSYSLSSAGNEVVAAVDITPSANGNKTLRGLHDTISEILMKHPYGFVVLAGDFNHNTLKTVLPKFKQFVDFKTRGDHTLDWPPSRTF